MGRRNQWDLAVEGLLDNTTGRQYSEGAHLGDCLVHEHQRQASCQPRAMESPNRLLFHCLNQ